MCLSSPRPSPRAADGDRLAVAVVHLSEIPAATARVDTDEGRQVASASPEPLARRFSGAELFGLSADEAAELLDAVADSLADDAETSDEPDPAGESYGDAGTTVRDGHLAREAMADSDAGQA